MGKGRTIAGPLDPGGDYDPDDDLDIDDGLPMRNEIDPKGIKKDGDKGEKQPAAKRGKPVKESRVRGNNKGH